MGLPWSLFLKFSVFLQQIIEEKCTSSFLLWDSNSQPSDYESPPITTTPGLPFLEI